MHMGRSCIKSPAAHRLVEKLATANVSLATADKKVGIGEKQQVLAAASLDAKESILLSVVDYVQMVYKATLDKPGRFSRNEK